MERILVGLDEGAAADGAARRALELEAATGARVRFVHAIPSEGRSWNEPRPETPEQMRQRQQAAALADRAAHLRQLAGAGTGTPDLEVFHGPAGRVLLERARSWNADLLILGGHRDLGFLHLGSTVRTALSHSDCPVWIQAEPLRPLRSILAAVDLSSHGPLVLQWAAALAGLVHAELRVLHCFVPPTLAYAPGFSGPTAEVDELRRQERLELERLVERCAGGRDLEPELDDGEPWQRILERGKDCDLVVMGTHGHTSVVRTILGSQAFRVVQRSERPVVAVPSPGATFTWT